MNNISTYVIKIILVFCGISFMYAYAQTFPVSKKQFTSMYIKSKNSKINKPTYDAGHNKIKIIINNLKLNNAFNNWNEHSRVIMITE